MDDPYEKSRRPEDLRTTSGTTPDLEHATPGLDRTRYLRLLAQRAGAYFAEYNPRRVLDGLRKRLTPKHG